MPSGGLTDPFRVVPSGVFRMQVVHTGLETATFALEAGVFAHVNTLFHAQPIDPEEKNLDGVFFAKSAPERAGCLENPCEMRRCTDLSTKIVDKTKSL